MAKYIYPAIFTVENDGGFSVDFPGFDGICGIATQGDNLQQAIFMAQDALCLALYTLEQDGIKPPAPLSNKDIKINPEVDMVQHITCDTEFYKHYYENKAVRKNLTIPAYLNFLAEKHNINFSLVLQEALKQKLNVG